MIRNRIGTGILILLFYLLQTTVFHSIKLANVVPNLLLILTVSIAYLRGRSEGLITGFICGLMLDMQFGTVIGLYAFIYMLIGFVIGHWRKIYYADEYLVPAILVGAADFVYGIFYYIVEFLLRGRLDFGFYFLHKILPELIYTSIIALILCRLIFLLEKKLYYPKGENDNADNPG